MDLMSPGFIKDASKVVIVGPNGVGKSRCAASIAHQAVLAGHPVLFVNATHMLGELGALDSDSSLRRYAAPQLLVIDETGYLSCDNRHADLLFQLINARCQQEINVITTNRAFGEWVPPQGGPGAPERACPPRQGQAGGEGRMSRRRSCSHTCDCGVLAAAAHWTPEQALAACELLMELQQAPWKLQGPQIQQACLAARATDAAAGHPWPDASPRESSRVRARTPSCM